MSLEQDLKRQDLEAAWRSLRVELESSKISVNVRSRLQAAVSDVLGSAELCTLAHEFVARDQGELLRVSDTPVNRKRDEVLTRTRPEGWPQAMRAFSDAHKDALQADLEAHTKWHWSTIKARDENERRFIAALK